MPENIGDRPSETQTNPPSANLLKETIPIKKKEVVVPQRQIENINPPPHVHHERKKTWRSYSWEFLMLFLAVFCGYLAQYYLEHRIEKERGNQYVRSMIEDIVSDSTKINTSYEFGKKQEVGLDSLSRLFDNPPYNDTTIKRMYLLMLQYTMNEANVAFTKRTVSQLKNSGGMRLISNKISADEITRYTEGAEAIELQGEYFRNIAIKEMAQLNSKIFYLKYIKAVTRKNIDSFMSREPISLANNNENLLVEYSNQLFFASGLLINYNNKLTDFKSKICKTIEILKNENHIQ